VLKQANQEVIKRIRSEQTHVPLSSALFGASGKRSASVSMDTRAMMLDSPPPGSSASLSSTPSKSVGSWGSHSRRPSELPNRSRGSQSSYPSDLGYGHSRRNSLPSRLRSASYALQGSDSRGPPRPPYYDVDTPPSSVASPNLRHSLLPSALQDTPAPNDGVKSVDVLIAEDNPISSKVLETILVRLGCRCVVVHNGEEVVRCTMGELVFDVIFVSCFLNFHG
jgi:serine/threonine-protein kinase RIM15